MINDNNNIEQNNPNNKERNLSDVFKELQEIRYSQNVVQTPKKTKIPKPKKHKKNNDFAFEMDINSVNKTKKSFKLPNILVISAVFVLAVIALFPKNAFLKESFAKEDTEEVTELTSTNFEINRKALNMQKIISENSSFEKVKEQVTEEREIEYEVNSQANPSLPRGEQIVLQEGVAGKENVSLVKTYENGEFIEELILSKEVIQEPVPQILDVGTSDFLAKLKVHIGDTIYLTSDTILRASPDASSEEVADIKQSLDVKLLELPSEDWCKVSFDTIEGYLPTKNLTSAYATPTIVEKNRVQRILLKVNIDMELNKSSGLTLKDYQKIFTGLPKDTNKIFEDNAEVFYNMDKKYNINGIFLASMAIHESAWGTSEIAKDKKNLFGYGAYDETPYESSYEFEDYKDGIELVAKVLVKYYLNPSGTKIYDGETASAWYYNGPTLAGVNVRYASDEDWHTKVYSYMEMLYNRLK